ncbi:MAG: FtsX-like permease family protein [Bdellovibrionaceae bacterium]|nr:FtsX-like permease family protein [Pseudobdellovibrionaceae bacterium]
MAYLNLFRNKRRSLSTALAICVGYVGLNLLGAYVYRVKRALDATSVYSAQHGHVKVYKKESLVYFALNPKKYILDQQDLKSLGEILSKQSSYIEYIGHNLTGSGLLSNGQASHPVMFLSFESDVYARSLAQPELKFWAPDWVLPAQFENIKLFQQNSEMMSLTPKIEDIMGLKQPLASNESLQMAARSLDGDLNAVNLDLGAEHTTGMQFLEDTLVLIPFAKAQELLATDGSESISIYLKPGADFRSFKAKLDQSMDGLGLESYLYFDERINSVYLGTLGFLIVMCAFVVFLIGTAVALTIANSLTMGIIERSREIGTLMAIGFKKRDVTKLFLYESLVLCTFSVIAGVVLTFVISAIVNYIDIRFSPPGIAAAVQFKLVWNFTLALSLTLMTYIIVAGSALFVMVSRSKLKLIDLLQDAGA